MNLICLTYKLTIAAAALALHVAAGRCGEYPATPIRAIDGDTILCDVHLGLDVTLSRQAVRVDGVNTPERGAPGYIEARAFVAAWLAEGQVMLVTGAQEREKYGRILARVHRGPRDLTTELIAMGLGKPYSGGAR